jgi:hypothetical protein
MDEVFDLRQSLIKLRRFIGSATRSADFSVAKGGFGFDTGICAPCVGKPPTAPHAPSKRWTPRVTGWCGMQEHLDSAKRRQHFGRNGYVLSIVAAILPPVL